MVIKCCFTDSGIFMYKTISAVFFSATSLLLRPSFEYPFLPDLFNYSLFDISYGHNLIKLTHWPQHWVS